MLPVRPLSAPSVVNGSRLSLRSLSATFEMNVTEIVTLSSQSSSSQGERHPLSRNEVAVDSSGPPPLTVAAVSQTRQFHSRAADHSSGNTPSRYSRRLATEFHFQRQ